MYIYVTTNPCGKYPSIDHWQLLLAVQNCVKHVHVYKIRELSMYDKLTVYWKYRYMYTYTKLTCTLLHVHVLHVLTVVFCTPPLLSSSDCRSAAAASGTCRASAGQACRRTPGGACSPATRSCQSQFTDVIIFCGLLLNSLHRKYLSACTNARRRH